MPYCSWNFNLATVHQLRALYVYLMCVPLEHFSKLQNIFLFQLAHADDCDTLPQKNVYFEVIEELNFLADEGIEIHFKTRKLRIFFSLVGFTGDNLGLNKALGFSQSFSANYFCRFCIMNKGETKLVVLKTP